MRFDHLTHHVPDLAAAMSDYTDLGFSMKLVGSDSVGGTRIAFCRNGRSYWELIGVDDMLAFERQQAQRQERYPDLIFSIVDAVKGGGGVTSFAVEVADLDAVVGRLRAAGLPIAEPVRRGRQEESGKWTWAMAGLTGGPAWLPFFIEYAVPGDQRLAALPMSSWRINHLIIETQQPLAGGQTLSALLGLELCHVESERWVVPLPGATVHLVPGNAERITTVVLSGAPGLARDISGLRLAGTN